MHSIFFSRMNWMFSLGLLFWNAAGTAAQAQLTVLSKGNPTATWRSAQLGVLEEQLRRDTLPDDMRRELTAQRRWLSAWKPGEMTEEPLWEPPASVSPPVAEPIFDPENLAAELRERLFGATARPTVADTRELEQLLKEHSADLGVRQLHLHWLDQVQYRRIYPAEIAEAALKLLSMLELSAPAEADSYAQGRAHTLYRRVRALAYRELPEVVEQQPIEDRAKYEAELIGAYEQLKELVGHRAEFIKIDVRMLRRDGQYGRALELLTDHGKWIEKPWFLKQRRDLLRELGWESPATEAADIYARAFPAEGQPGATAGSRHSDELD
jgi:hypothetical protein